MLDFLILSSATLNHKYSFHCFVLHYGWYSQIWILVDTFSLHCCHWLLNPLLCRFYFSTLYYRKFQMYESVHNKEFPFFPRVPGIQVQQVINLLLEGSWILLPVSAFSLLSVCCDVTYPCILWKTHTMFLQEWEWKGQITSYSYYENSLICRFLEIVLGSLDPTLRIALHKDDKHFKALLHGFKDRFLGNLVSRLIRNLNENSGTIAFLFHSAFHSFLCFWKLGILYSSEFFYETDVFVIVIIYLIFLDMFVVRVVVVTFCIILVFGVDINAGLSVLLFFVFIASDTIL